jgi:hypothetical protein
MFVLMQPSLGWTTPEKSKEVEALQHQIVILNLLNALYLTDTQMRDLLAVAREAKEIRAHYLSQLEAVDTEALQAFAQLKEELQEEDFVSTEIERCAAKLNHQKKELRYQYLQDMDNLENKITHILTDNQLYIIDEFKPCLIPPKDLKSPTRAGQADSSSHLEKMLTRIREIPEETFNQRIVQLLEKHISRIQMHFGPMTDAEIEEEKRRVLTILEEARSMSDLDFALNKENLAKKLKPLDEYEVLRKELDKEGKKRGHLGKTGKIFLSGEIIPLLEERLQ